jgi:hypothetical protein
MTEAPKFSFAIIKHRGDLNHAETADGYKVHRQKKVWLDATEGSRGRYVMCAPYDNFFIFIDPAWKKMRGRWFAMCACGSPAVLIGSDTYAHDASPSTEGTVKGEMLVCMIHAQTGHHADGSS